MDSEKPTSTDERWNNDDEDWNDDDDGNDGRETKQFKFSRDEGGGVKLFEVS